jgi:hypothetical protein
MLSSHLLNLEEKRVDHSSPSAFSIGRTVGILLLLQLTAALTLPFILSKPITLGSPAFLSAVTEHSFQIRSAVLLSFVGSGLTIYLGITAFQVFRLYSLSGALLFLVVCAISATLDVVQAATIMSMLSISKQFIITGDPDVELYKVVGGVVASARRSAHFTQLLAIGVWLFVFYLSLFRFKLVPLALAGLGLLGVVLQFSGVTLMMFLGYRSIGELAMPLLPIQILVAVWLIIKGFNDPALKLPARSNLGQS